MAGNRASGAWVRGRLRPVAAAAQLRAEIRLRLRDRGSRASLDADISRRRRKVPGAWRGK